MKPIEERKNLWLSLASGFALCWMSVELHWYSWMKGSQMSI